MQPLLAASELIEKLRNSTTVDWQFSESVRVRMRILRKYKYPPDGYDDAITLGLQQAEELEGAWTEG